MPHFKIDCSANALALHDEQHIFQQIHLVANSTGLFDEGDIKVTSVLNNGIVNPFDLTIGR